MGEVYRARDTRLDRTVAVKILRDTQPDLQARFAREAKAIAALAHPNICAVYDIGREASTDYLVMECLEGETLAARLHRGALPLDQALRAAIEIGSALDKAHRAGIVHRDLKPSNVMLTTAGVKLLDFGLAKFRAASQSPETKATLTETLSGDGRLIGTVPYMAPEQLEGREADARSDLFAFGAVLFEILTGRRAFAGESQASVIAAILEHDPPPISTLQPLTPPTIDRIVKKCLKKDPEDRWQTARDLVDELRWIGQDAKTSELQSGISAPQRRVRAAVLVAAGVAVAAVSLALGAFFGAGPRGSLSETSARFLVLPPAGTAFARGPDSTFLALSPDGSRLALVAKGPTGETEIWLRPLSDLEARPVAGTEGATSVFWSPDGRSLAFPTGDKLKRVDLAGNAIQTVCDIPDGGGITGTWGGAGRIVFAAVSGQTILSVQASGGIPTVEVSRDESRGETGLQWPWFLPGPGRLVYVARLRDGKRMLMLIEAGKVPRPILSVASNVEWVDPDHFVFARSDGTLMAQRFDLAGGRTVGDPALVAQSVDYAFGSGRAMFTVSANGNVAYQPQQFQRMAWVDRAGKELESVGPPAEYGPIRLSADGKDLLVSRMRPGAGTYDLWALDLRRGGVETRLTSDPGNHLGGVWMPGGRAVAFSADRGTPPPHVVRKDLATDAVDDWLPPGKFQLVNDVSPDGTTLVFSERNGSAWDLSVLSLTGSRKRSALFQSPFHAMDGRFSPDGRFVSFTSLDSGNAEVYVAPFPVGARVRVSRNGGGKARWSRDGRELYYLSADRHLVAIPVRTRSALELGTPVSLFKAEFAEKGGGQEEFEVAPDGSRFITVVPGPRPPVAVVEHWIPVVRR